MKRVAIRTLVTVPWCCVFTLGMAALSVGNVGLAAWTDTVSHAFIPFSFLFHGWMGVRLYREHRHECECGHRTRERWLFALSLTVLIATTAFHFTPWHDRLLHYK